MAYTLKSTGLAANLLYCARIDEDGTTLKEFVNGWTSTTADGGTTWTDNNASRMDVIDGCTVANNTWKSVAFDHFQITRSGDYTPKHITFPGTDSIPGATGESGFGVFIAAAGASGGGGKRILMNLGGSTDGLHLNGSAQLVWQVGATFGPSTTPIPLDGTKFSIGGNYQHNGTVEFFYGPESGSLAADGTDTTDGRTLGNFQTVGGVDGQGTQTIEPFIVCVFDRYLTESEYQTLHNDFHGTLFDTGSSDTTAPTFTSGPSAANIADTSLDIQYTCDETNTTYIVVLADGATAPTSSEVKAGTGSGGATPEASSSTSSSGGLQATQQLTGLTAGTAYDVYVVAEDDESTPNLQASPTLVNVTTAAAADTTAPTFTAGPSAANIADTSLDIQATLDEAGMIYAVVVADGAAAPNSSEVKAGQSSGGGSPVASGSTTAAASTQETISLTGLSASTAYDVYVVAEDDEATPNLQANPTLVNATTAAATVTATVTDVSGNPLVNETSIEWAWSDTFGGTPTDTGTGETTDGSGVLSVDVPNTGLTSGQTGYLSVKLASGNVGISAETID